MNLVNLYNAKKKVTELETTSGKVVFSYETGNEQEVHEFDEQTFSLEFDSLDEMIELLQEKKLDELKQERNVENVFVDSIEIISMNDTKNVRAETLLLDDVIFTEISEIDYNI